MSYFSIIIPLYNKENYIQSALRSILEQTFQDFEIVIVDDCSTDKSVQKAKEIQSEKIRYISHEHNKGLSASRNTGIRNAKADFTVFLDADDVWRPQFLEKIKELIARFPQSSLFATAYEEIYPDNLVLKPSVNKADLRPEATLLITDFFVKNMQQPIYNHSSLCIRKSFFEIIGNYDEAINFSEDVDFNIRANRRSPLAFYNQSQSCYTVYSENQITTSGIQNRTIPTLDTYTDWEKEDENLKKYIDFERYVLATHCKLADRKADFEKFKSAIDLNNLTTMQRILLHLPKGILIAVKRVKVYFLLKGFRMTSF